jgi:EmrB/QacA subfamily drug resistance transporter
MNTKSKRILGFMGLLLVGFMGNLDFSVVSVTLPSIQEHFNTNITNIMWINLIFSLVGTSVLIPIAKFGDMFGRKKVLLLCLSVFVISSALCGFAPSLGVLVLGRGLQALGASALMTISIPIALEIFPNEKRNLVAGVWGGFIGLAIAVGPSIGGYIAEFFNWRYIFFINIPLGVLGFLLIFRFIEESTAYKCSREIDWLGILTLAVALSSFTYALTNGTSFGFTSKKILILFSISVISFIVFLIVENKVLNPLIDFSIFKVRSFTVSSVVASLIGVVTIIAFNFINFFFKSISNYTTLESGNVLFFLALGLIVSSLISGKLASRFKISHIIFFSILICFIAVALLTSITPNTSKLTFMLLLFIAGLGIGTPGTQLMATALADIPSEKNGLASGLNNLTQKMFMLVLTAIMTCSLVTNLNNAKIKAAQSQSLVSSSNAFTSTFKLGFIFLAVALILCPFITPKNQVVTKQ